MIGKIKNLESGMYLKMLNIRCKNLYDNKIFRYLFPIVLGNCIMLLFRWKWLWTGYERILQVSFEEETVQWGNVLLRLAAICFIAVCVKWNMRQEVFYDKGKIALKGKIIWLLFLFFVEDLGAEVIWKFHVYGEGGKGVYNSSFLILDSISAINFLFLSYILAAALTEELLYRYIICNCLRMLRLNYGVIIVIQAVIFAAAHRYEWSDLLNVFLGGVVYGSILYLTRTPICSWLLHSAYNLKVISDGPIENAFFVISFIVCVMYVVISESMYKKKIKRKKKKRSAGRRVNPMALTLYPLQLANVERLENNERVVDKK